MSARALFALLFALISAAMLGMAAGAVWMLPTLYMQRALPWLALPMGWLLGRAIRGWVRSEPRGAATLAALATAIASLYVGMLTAAARIAGSMGLGLVDAIRTAGTGLLVSLTRLATTNGDLAWYALGIALAAYAAWSAKPAAKL
ncbi:vitamin B12 transport system permease protein [Dyella sp. OK004]|uniref:hypothetical protein n=1 Tax=Dyella sp. OK004 TaxID=1855292 RepID=UPI0008E152A4|nr:hypothetical protein [Dyella sp. OK004]SFR85517.1 vitamin B12 transport system permease protein [Dyella sp. OK004]